MRPYRVLLTQISGKLFYKEPDSYLDEWIKCSFSELKHFIKSDKYYIKFI